MKISYHFLEGVLGFGAHHTNTTMKMITGLWSREARGDGQLFTMDVVKKIKMQPGGGGAHL